MLEERIMPLKRELIEYATLVENMIEKVIKGLMENNKNYPLEVIEKDEPRTDRYEVDLDEKCIWILAQFQPMAVDLRTILMMLEMNRDLERIGDLSASMSRSIIFLIERPQVKPYIDIPRMSEIVQTMIKDSVNAFIENDSQLAREVFQRDKMVNGLRDQIIRELLTFMSSDPSTIERSFHLISLALDLERIGDHSTNICEDVVFMVEGEVIKHLDDKNKDNSKE
ncbi:MAG: phosphate signaling complex protein PhoU [Atribacterota bacterium]|jgi:phosphate transport system protein|nr:phosphate signaling complex protein PhoU [Atribacterota bacterium]MDD3032313.1 phosphate signaling complex protein PhoU [Atribacterota bacterium]MDD3640923.1 phosphate signaling complex protein PhoU [Atribacterota bacterium]MDD4288923.1 phosphate signaling complex protein PhoU [Atribacterota bacterium]MDD4765070.1 phosphate signaling complex protein PhoU [Atribacterota bacterium]